MILKNVKIMLNNKSHVFASEFRWNSPGSLSHWHLDGLLGGAALPLLPFLAFPALGFAALATRGVWGRIWDVNTGDLVQVWAEH